MTPPGEPGGAYFKASYEARRLGFLNLSGLFTATFSVVFQHEGDLVTLVERVDARRFERGGMDEDVLVAAFRLDEAKALGRVEELHSTCSSHVGVLSR
jgi:hypothetical protein